MKKPLSAGIIITGFFLIIFLFGLNLKFQFNAITGGSIQVTHYGISKIPLGGIGEKVQTYIKMDSISIRAMNSGKTAKVALNYIADYGAISDGLAELYKRTAPVKVNPLKLSEIRSLIPPSRITENTDCFKRMIRLYSNRDELEFVMAFELTYRQCPYLKNSVSVLPVHY